MLHYIKTSLFLLAIIYCSSCTTNEAKNEPIPHAVLEAAIEETNKDNSSSIIENYTASFTSSPQKFILPSNAKQWITSKKGLKVLIDAKNLCHTDGTFPQGKIEVNVKELTTLDELMHHNAPSQSNGKILVTGGSYYIDVTNNGKPLLIKPNRSLQVKIPNLKQKGMKLFYGEKDNNGFINWNTTNTSFVSSSYTSSSYSQFSNNESIKIGDSVGKRPATYHECVKIYKDSVMNARWAYTIANRNKLTHRQEMIYGLRPIEFPEERYKNGMQNINASSNRLYHFGFCFNASVRVSSMYLVEDTFPIYKEIKKAINEKSTTSEKLDYYEPTEIKQLGWINVDKFYETPLCDSTIFVFENNVKLTNCRIYYKFASINSLLAESIVFEKGKPDGSFTAITKLPKNEAVEIFLVGVIANTIYTSRKKIKTTSMNQIKLNVQVANKKV